MKDSLATTTKIKTSEIVLVVSIEEKEKYLQQQAEEAFEWETNESVEEKHWMKILISKQQKLREKKSDKKNVALE